MMGRYQLGETEPRSNDEVLFDGDRAVITESKLIDRSPNRSRQAIERMLEDRRLQQDLNDDFTHWFEA